MRPVRYEGVYPSNRVIYRLQEKHAVDLRGFLRREQTNTGEAKGKRKKETIQTNIQSRTIGRHWERVINVA
jgi:hypothetical protein